MDPLPCRAVTASEDSSDLVERQIEVVVERQRQKMVLWKPVEGRVQVDPLRRNIACSGRRPGLREPDDVPPPERRALRHSFATMARNQGRSSAPGRNRSRPRQAFKAASCTASSAAPLSLSIVMASRKAGSRTGASSSPKASASPALARSRRCAESSLKLRSGCTRQAAALLRAGTKLARGRV